MQTALEKKIFEERRILKEKIFLSTLIPGVDLKATPKKDVSGEEVEKEEGISALTLPIMDLIIQQNLS